MDCTDLSIVQKGFFEEKLNVFLSEICVFFQTGFVLDSDPLKFPLLFLIHFPLSEFQSKFVVKIL